MTEPGVRERRVRATQRCLADDIGLSIEPAGVRPLAASIAAQQADDLNFLLPCRLVDLRHPLLDQANYLTDPGAVREPIRKITDSVVYKVKTGVHRGALWKDDTGTWWLLAGGVRQDDGSGDFYRRLPASLVEIAPTTADLRYQGLEDAYDAQCLEEKAAQRAVIGAVMDAAASPGVGIDVEVFGAEMTIRINEDESDLAILEVSWDFREFDQQDRFPADVLAMVPGLSDMEHWQYWPGRDGAPTVHAYQAIVPMAWVRDLATSTEIDSLLPDPESWSPPSPATDGSEHFSHYSGRRAVTMAYVEGVEIVGFCGARVVAHRDYAAFPVCPDCKRAVELLRATGHS